MLRIATVVLFVFVLIAVSGVISAGAGVGSGGPSAVADLFGGFAQDALACTGGCRKP